MLRLVAAVCAAVGTDLAVDDEDGARARGRVDPDLGAHTVRGEVCEQQAAGCVVTDPARDHGFRSEVRRAASRVQRRAPRDDRNRAPVPLARGGDVDHQVADGDEADHAARRRAASTCSAVGPPARQRPKRFQHGARIALVPFRGECQRLVKGSAAVGARQRERRQEGAGLAAGKHPQQLDDRRRAPDLVRWPSGGVGAARRSDTAHGELGQCESTSCGKRSGSASMRTMLRGSW